MKLTLVSRGGWGARPPRFAIATDADETFQHHTAGGHRGAPDVRAIQNFHMDIRGWSDIAYNFLIDRFTNVVYEGRGWGVRPGSQRNYNTGTWSVCLMGDFRTAVPTKANLATVAALIRHGESLGHIPRVLTGGHKDAPGQATTCPGPNLYARIPTIRDLLEADMSQNGPENWDQADWDAFDARAGRSVMVYWLPDPDGVAPGTQGNPYDTKALHFNTIFRKVRGDTAASLEINRQIAKAQREGRTLTDTDIDRIIAEYAESFGLIERDT